MKSSYLREPLRRGSLRRFSLNQALMLLSTAMVGLSAFAQDSQGKDEHKDSARARVRSVCKTGKASSHALAWSQRLVVQEGLGGLAPSTSALPFLRGDNLVASTLGHGAADALDHKVMAAYGNLPLSFELNQGQTDGSVRFLSRGLGYALFLTRSEALLSLRQPTPPDFNKLPAPRTSAIAARTEKFGTQKQGQDAAHSVVLRSQLVNANPQAKILGVEDLPGKSNYFIGSDPKTWHTDVPTYAKIKYQDVYPGVDLVYYGNQGRLEFDFIVAPGADPKKIGLAIVDSTLAAQSGAELKDSSALRIDPDGDLVVTTQAGEVRYRKPVAYQLGAGSEAQQRRDDQVNFVEAHYVLKPKQEVGFEVDSYDATEPLIIDPVLVYSTFVAGNFYDQASAIAVDSSGSAYITGSTFSSVPTFPTTAGAYQTTCGTDGVCNYTLPNGGTSNTDVFVTKLSADGSQLVYSTYLGGSYDEAGNGIAVDSSGYAYVTGYTRSQDFPVTSGAFQKVCGPATLINYSCQAIVQSTCGGANRVDGFVTKLNASGSGLIYSTFLGGVGNDSLNAIAVNAAGEAYVAGTTDSNANTPYAQNYPTCPALGLSSDYPTTPGGYMAAPPLVSPTQPAWPGFAPNAVFSKLSTDGSSLLYSTYFGAPAPYLSQGANSLALDTLGNAYIVGSTNSPSFPTTSGAFQTVLNQGGGIPGGACGGANCHDAFVAKFDPTKSGAASLVYSTFLGGAGEDAASAIAVDPSGNAYVTGAAGFNGAPTLDFPTTSGAFQSSCPSLPSCTNYNAFVTELDPTATGLVYSSYLGGGPNGSSGANAIAVDSSGRAYVAGSTNSYDFPQKNPTQGFIPSVEYAFVSIFKADGSGLDFSTYLGGNGYTFGQGIALNPSDDMYVTGYTLAKDFPTTTGAFQTNCGNCGNSGSNRAPFVTKISAQTTIASTTIAITSAPAVTYPANGIVTVTVSSTGGGTPTGNATLSVDGGSPLSQTLDASGVAMFTITSPSVGSHSLSASYAAQGSFGSSSGTGSLSVGPAPLTVTAANATKVYGAPLPGFSVNYNGFVNGDGPSSLSGKLVLSTTATQGSPVGSYAIMPSGLTSSNYAIAFGNGTLSVTPATLTVSANNATKTLDAPNPSFASIVAGFVNGDTVAVLTANPACTATATTTSPVGSYPINCSSAVAANYTFAYVSGTLKILYASSGLCDSQPGHQILPPINADGSSVIKQGRKIPAIFRVCDANGVSIGTPGVVSSFFLTGIHTGTSSTNVENFVDTNNPDSAFRWDSSNLQWVFNISTSNLAAGSTYVYTITLNDGSTINFQFGLR
jgi:MBG domain (YGX type)/Bacterial Ig-like domain (group 3)/Beta-propeller repeat